MEDYKSSLIHYFKAGQKEDHRSALGVEIEHFIIDLKQKTAVTYSGMRGVRSILYRLMENYTEAAIIPDDDFFGFTTDEFSVTLEPAAQLEISIMQNDSIEKIERIYENLIRCLNTILEEYGYAAITMGCQPYSPVSDIEMIPKRRYDYMHKYFLQNGAGGVEMMRGTASLQVSIDYHSESDFRDKAQAAFYCSPILKLLCDNAPCFQGKPLNTHLKRTDIWRRVDPVRCGILPNVFQASYGYGDYADFLAAMPLIFIKKDTEVHPTGKRTVADIYEGRALGKKEIEHILSMAFPDVRLKQYLEIRIADSVPLPFMTAYLTLIKGLLYSEEGLAFAREEICRSHISEADIIRAEDTLMISGWDAVIYGKPVSEMAKRLLEIARRNLPDTDRKYLHAFDAVIKYGGIHNIPKNVYEKVSQEPSTVPRTK